MNSLSRDTPKSCEPTHALHHHEAESSCLPHEADHSQSAEHHHHSHAQQSHHGGGHHLLQVSNLSISFSMYDDAESTRGDTESIHDDAESASGNASRAHGKAESSRTCVESTPSGAESSRTCVENAPITSSAHVRTNKRHKSKCASLKAFLNAPKKQVPVIHELSISVHAGEIVAVVGASGSGKTLLADAIMGLYEDNASVTGEIWFDGSPQTAESLQCLRGSDIAFVPQQITSLDPLMKVGKQLRQRGRSSRSTQKLEDLFARYNLDPKVAYMYPHELSGGMARRVLLCCALMESPKLIIADEPTPGLDLELAVKAMEDFRDLANAGVGIMLITHDIDLALRVADRIAIFKEGSIVEETSVNAFKEGELKEPFSRQLRNALPEFGFVC